MSATTREITTAIEGSARREPGAIPVLGLIGAIGGGKSRVAESLAARGALVVDADSIGHQMLAEPSIRDRVIARFGPGIIRRDGSSEGANSESSPIDRKALAAIVFSDPAALRHLETVLHPPMRQKFARIIDHAERYGTHRAVVLDAAVLLEAGWHGLCDRVIFIDAPRERRVERVREQRGWSAETLSARERAQWPLDRKRRCSDIVIMNDADLEHLEHEVDRLWSAVVEAWPVDRLSAGAGLVASPEV